MQSMWNGFVNRSKKYSNVSNVCSHIIAMYHTGYTTMPQAENTTNKELPKTTRNKARFLKAYKAKLGNIGLTCKAINISRECFKVWRRDDEVFRQALLDVEEEMIDNGESTVYIAGKADWRAMGEWLKVKGKERGWGNSIDLRHTIEIVVEPDPDFDD